MQPIIWGRLQAWACKVAELCPHELLLEHGLLDISQEVSSCGEICVMGCGWKRLFAQVTQCRCFQSGCVPLLFLSSWACSSPVAHGSTQGECSL